VLASITIGGAAQSVIDSTVQAASSKPHLELLPIGTQRGRGPQKRERRYVWDGKRVVTVDEERLGQVYTPSGRLLQWWSDLRDSLGRAFLPDRRDVTPDYWEWMHWRLTQRFFSSTMQNLATQSLLLALGMGAKRTIAASAAINWLLKDGVGRIARMTLATNFGQSFDSDLKRIRFLTSTIFDTTIGCEFITPFFPQHFLALASVSNVGKAMALAAFVATAPAFQQALCTGGNIADVTAKGQAQHMVMDMLALGVSASAMYLAKNMKTPALLPLAAYPFLAVGDCYCIYRELKAVQLRTLNRERAELVAEQWVKMGKVPHTEEICERETLLLPPNVCNGTLPLTITSVEGLVTHPSQVQHLMSRYKDTQYMLALHDKQTRAHASPAAAMLPGPLQRLTTLPPRLVVSLSETAKGADVLTAVLEAAYIRQAVTEHVRLKQAPETAATTSTGRRPGHSNSSHSSSGSRNVQASSSLQARQDRINDPLSGEQGEGGSCGGIQSRGRSASSKSGCSGNNTAVQQQQPLQQQQQQQQQEAEARARAQAAAAAQLRYGFPLSEKELESLALGAHRRATRDAKRFVKEVSAAGWKVDPFLLSTTEKEGYILMPKKK